MPSFEVFVNEDVTGDHIALMLRDADIIESEDELCPMLQMTPETALLMMQALLSCIERIQQDKA